MEGESNGRRSGQLLFVLSEPCQIHRHSGQYATLHPSVFNGNGAQIRFESNRMER